MVQNCQAYHGENTYIFSKDAFLHQLRNQLWCHDGSDVCDALATGQRLHHLLLLLFHHLVLLRSLLRHLQDLGLLQMAVQKSLLQESADSRLGKITSLQRIEQFKTRKRLGEDTNSHLLRADVRNNLLDGEKGAEDRLRSLIIEDVSVALTKLARWDAEGGWTTERTEV